MNPYRYQLGYRQIRDHRNRVIRERNAVIYTTLVALGLAGVIGLLAIYVASQWK